MTTLPWREPTVILNTRPIINSRPIIGGHVNIKKSKHWKWAVGSSVLLEIKKLKTYFIHSFITFLASIRTSITLFMRCYTFEISRKIFLDRGVA